MLIKRHILLILFALCTSSAWAQLAFDPAEWDFGTLPEANGRVSHTFTGVNRGEKPIVILDVMSTCGCTVPEFSRQPIMPGGNTQITVTFDPTNRPGAFNKELYIYSSERQKIATLTIRGSVTARPKSIEELYPIDMGGGLRLTSTLCTFSYIHQGQRVSGTIGYINTTNRTLTLALRPQDTSDLLTANIPNRIIPGEKGDFTFSYFIPTDKPRYGTLRDVSELLIDGRSNGTLLMVHGIGVDNLKDGAKQSAPKAELSENILKFGPVKHRGPVQRRQFTLSNTGAGELIVRAVECGEGFTTTLTPGRQVAAGGSFTAQIVIDPAKLEYGPMTGHLVLITNDPERQMRRLRVTAIIED